MQIHADFGIANINYLLNSNNWSHLPRNEWFFGKEGSQSFYVHKRHKTHKHAGENSGWILWSFFFNHFVERDSQNCVFDVCARNFPATLQMHESAFAKLRVYAQRLMKQALSGNEDDIKYATVFHYCKTLEAFQCSFRRKYDQMHLRTSKVIGDTTFPSPSMNDKTYEKHECMSISQKQS